MAHRIKIINAHDPSDLERYFSEFEEREVDIISIQYQLITNPGLSLDDDQLYLYSALIHYEE